MSAPTRNQGLRRYEAREVVPLDSSADDQPNNAVPDDTMDVVTVHYDEICTSSEPKPKQKLQPSMPPLMEKSSGSVSVPVSSS